MRSKTLIINADDFGYDLEATAGILELLSEQKISSTTIMANLVNQADLLSVQKIPAIGTGLHLNLISGKPLSSPADIPSLVGQDGNFLGAKGLLKNAFLNKIKPEQVYLEIKAQLALLETNGIHISHVDSHQHAHQYPMIGPIIQSALARLKIQKIRNSKPLGASVAFRSVLLQVFTTLSGIDKKSFVSPEGIIAKFSFGQEITMDGFEKALTSSFEKACNLEFMTHPALEDREDSYLKRKEEYLFWKNEPVKELLSSQGIRLIHFGEL
ncbi:carbohydrate deacetylase [Algoriphagus chordae]|uniref:Putative glycoside hydrolase/deacetylase ChbG (UPF0249 family) n=1 Tax=Algoriphagus chordae TaxID=237019 RepID=A0A2W7S0T9_9BACT|nr:ChbG/HpnK family deacetylase [Algoriphagus chordae]PZX56715.1 putative glycoside hydrolase/deacetylase ChbG (UPF0249 family) [Algoriphagus chordae]